MDVGMRAAFALCLFCVALVGCRRQEHPAVSHTKVISPQAGAAADGLNDAGSRAHASFDIRHPPLAPEFAAVNHAPPGYAAHQKAAFPAAANAADACTQE